jgi:large repetitive protein
LTKTGVYTLTIDGDGQETGSYRFRLVNITDPAITNITIGGADTLEQINLPGQRDRYTFNATAGQLVWFDVITANGGQLNWSLLDPDGLPVFTDFNLPDRQHYLRKTGVYTLTIDGDGQETGSYRFRLIDITGGTS